MIAEINSEVKEDHMLEFHRNETACFTGHRSYPLEDQPSIIASTDSIIASLYASGIRQFIAGGAIGFDTLAACRVLIAKRQFPDIKLYLALPCRNQTERWSSDNSLKLYKYILGAADEVSYISEMYTEGCMMKRNRFMVDNSSVCIAYYNGSDRGGTAATVRYARERGITVINVAPESKSKQLHIM